jgi:acyl-ACP thioesterase
VPDIPGPGRRFTVTRQVRLGDVDNRSLLRLDATARYLQDIATDDVADAELAEPFGWVVRRTTMVVDRPAMLGEQLELTTYCTGLGRSWAERSTTISGQHGADIRTVSLWVQVDSAAGRPAALTSRFIELYGPSADGRKVSPRLTLAGPGDANAQAPWQIRACDLDPFDHVNNAAHWAFVEEVIASCQSGRLGTFDLEFVNAITQADAVEIHPDRNANTGTWSAWLVSGARMHTAARWSRHT